MSDVEMRRLSGGDVTLHDARTRSHRTVALEPFEIGVYAVTQEQLSDVLGSVIGIAAASAIFATLHTTGGGDTHTYIVIWSVLAAVAALVVVSGRRCVPASADQDVSAR